jgi:hypothetical protein
VSLEAAFLKSWRPGNPDRAARLAAVIRSWEGTPYLPGQQRKKVGVDCVRFVCGVYDELLGRATPIHTLPSDACMNDPLQATQVMEKIAGLFGAQEVTSCGVILPGDVIATGPIGGGPGHCLVVGEERKIAWHAVKPRVCRTGFGAIYLVGHTVFKVYRIGGWK